MRSSKGLSHNKLVRFITIPLKALGKARDVYVRSLTSCASRVSYGQSSSGQYPIRLSSSRTFTTARSNENNEDLRELIRAATVRSLGHRNEMEMLLQQQLSLKVQNQMGSKGFPKSCSVGMGRIDEDKPCEFEENDAVFVVDDDKKKNKKQGFLYPRSRSVSFHSY